MCQESGPVVFNSNFNIILGAAGVKSHLDGSGTPTGDAGGQAKMMILT